MHLQSTAGEVPPRPVHVPAHVSASAQAPGHGPDAPPLQPGSAPEPSAAADLNANPNAELVRRYFDMWNTGDGSAADALLGPTYLDHALPDVVGPAASRSLAPRFHAAHPEVQTTIEVTLADAEFVTVRRVTRRLEDGAEVVTVGGARFRIAGGKLVEQWSW
jgi:predicted SnoaL-like aldol condensation-catalyzing enzyme